MMVKLHLFLLMIFVPLLLPAAKKEQPAWILSRPVNSEYFCGVGHSFKSDNKELYKSDARKDALNNLASEISVQIFSSEEFISVVRNDKMKQEFTSLIQSRVKTDLEGYEFVEEYEDKKEYWVYYHLSKALYRENELKKMNDAVTNARSCFMIALAAERKSDYKTAIIQYAKSLDCVKKYINEYIEIEVDGKKENLINKSFRNISTLIADLEIKPAFPLIKVKQSEEVSADKLTFYLNSKENKAISGFPLIADYTERSITDYSKLTGPKGEVMFSIPAVRSTKNQEVFKVSLDLNAILLESAADYLVRKAILDTNTPGAEVLIDIVKPTLDIRVVNQYAGKTFDDNTVLNAFKSQLLQAGYQLSNQPDITGEINIQTSFLSNNNGIIQTQLVGNIVFKHKNGKVIYSTAINPVKGTQLSIEKSVMDALKIFSTQIELRYCRELIEKIIK